MDRWHKTDPSGRVRAQGLLQSCARLVKHGYTDEALGKIAGGVALGFIEAANVCKELKVSPKALNTAVELYRQWDHKPVRFGEKD